MRHLHAHQIPIAISTGSTTQSMTLKRAGHEELFDMFQFIVCCSSDPEVKNGKPHPDAFDVARKRFEPVPEASSCLAFEDSLNGVKVMGIIVRNRANSSGTYKVKMKLVV